MKRPRLRLLRLRRPSRKTAENLVVAAGFFGGIATCATAVALVYFPAGLFFAGLALAALAGLYARTAPDEAGRE